MKTARIAAAQTVEFREDIEAGLSCVADIAARAESEGASLLCFPDGLIEVEEGRLFNTAIVVDRGVPIGRYRKMHLLSGEHIFDAGGDSRVFEVDGLRFGINICYDTNFREAAQKVADLGASLIVCPANAAPKNGGGVQERAQFRAE